MKPPSLDDRVVKVAAYLTDEVFGYTHWRAAQFSAPEAESRRPALLVVCQTEAQRDRLLAEVSRAISEVDNA